MQKKLLGKIVATVFFILWISSVVYWHYSLGYYGQNNPIEKTISEGKIYPYNYHGKIVYLNWNENFIAFYTPILAISILICILIGYIFMQLRKEGKKLTYDNILLILAKLKRK